MIRNYILSHHYNPACIEAVDVFLCPQEYSVAGAPSGKDI